MYLALIAIAAAAIGIVVAISARRVLAARREALRVREVFSRYVSPTIVDEILERRDPRLLAGRAGFASILVCRIWNFALFAEQLGPDEMLRYLNEFYTLAGKSIQKQRGMIDKFLADGIVAAFGFPLEDPLQEEHAIRAALDIIRLVDGMDARWVAQGRRPLRVGIGINSGNVIAGDVGFAQRREYTVVGLSSLVAARLQERTEPMHAYILVSEATLAPVETLFSTVPCPSALPMRGMKQNVNAFIVRGLARNLTEESLLLPATFSRTTLEEKVEDEIPVTPERVATVTVTPEPPAKPEPPKPLRPLIRARPLPAPDTSFEIPEVQGFGAIDDSPAFPDIPMPEDYYEDDSGRPPLKLPP